MIITISGNPGSGKSTVAKLLVKKLSWERIYVGGIRRDLAKKKGMTLEEFNAYAQTHFKEADQEVDKQAAKQAQELDKKGKSVIVEGRVQFHFLPESLKIYIQVSDEEGARRVWKDLQDKDANADRNEGKINSLTETKKSIIYREERDARRYKKYYGFDHRDLSQFDLLIDSTEISAEEVTRKIINFIKKQKKVK
ncbi:MAG: AAA family ATPase [Candidatus Woesearchaeota archaeon]